MCIRDSTQRTGQSRLNFDSQSKQCCAKKCDTAQRIESRIGRKNRRRLAESHLVLSELQTIDSCADSLLPLAITCRSQPSLASLVSASVPVDSCSICVVEECFCRSLYSRKGDTRKNLSEFQAMEGAVVPALFDSAGHAQPSRETLQNISWCEI